MVSFDVQSMFTSIPQDLAKRTLSKTMEETLGFLENQRLSSTELMGLISMCLDSTYFRFREHIYHQRKGTPMGSPISVVVAEAVMQQFEAELLRTVPPSLKLWVRYVDDVFAVTKDKDIDPFFTRLNSLEPAIQFSMELEVNGVLPFLDILVTRKGDHLETSCGELTRLLALSLCSAIRFAQAGLSWHRSLTANPSPITSANGPRIVKN
ncbi:uncharacterized protein LOC143028046 [Oratosquilla oratoria]|uniref:uncharacterized protein LOC143028046 n=1 Tax=Oratosquilla oratoria TaxID=337810 RepID=UPI003F75CCC0